MHFRALNGLTYNMYIGCEQEKKRAKTTIYSIRGLENLGIDDDDDVDDDDVGK
jgi:hypothetical protein